MIPLQKLSNSPIVTEFLHPDELFDYCRQTVDYELGGVALNDPSQGFFVRVWRLRVDGLNIVIDVPDDPLVLPVTLITTEYTASSVTLAFDQNMNPAVAYVERGTGKFWWYDTNIPGQTTTILGADVISPRTFLDDKRRLQTLTSDFLLFYLRAGALYFRAQRDRFLIEYKLKDTDAIGIARQGMNDSLRVQIELVYRLGYQNVNICGFTDEEGIVPGTLVVSNSVVLNGFFPIGGEVKISAGEYRVRTNVFAEWGEWTSEPSSIYPSFLIQLRTEAPSTFNTMKTVTVNLAQFVCVWHVTTMEPCTMQFSGEACSQTLAECLRFTGEEC